MLKLREINKAHTTFIDSILRYEHKGRIHAEINQLKKCKQAERSQEDLVIKIQTFNKFPLETQDLGPKIRSLFIPEDGCKWGCFDYNQQEPRLVVHYASLYKLPSVYEVVDSYKDNIKSDFHQTVADMAEIPRSQAKTN